MSDKVVNEVDREVVNVKEEDVQADYIIPIKRKLETNDGGIIKRQRSIANAYNSL